MQSVCAVAAAGGFERRARQLAQNLNLPYLEKPPATAAFSCVLVVSGLGLGLQLTGPKAPGIIRCDFVGGALDHRRRFGGGRRQDLARAVGLDKRRDLVVLDLTAGLGRDAFVLASLGARVQMLERHPVVHALLADGLQRANDCAESEDPELAAILQRLELKQGGSAEFLDALGEGLQPDVIYIDPMFPERQKSAKVKKEMQAFHALVGGDDDAGQLLPLSLQKALYRVVVKRPLRAPALAGMAPNYAITGKSTRYDVYPLKALDAKP